MRRKSRGVEKTDRRRKTDRQGIKESVAGLKTGDPSSKKEKKTHGWQVVCKRKQLERKANDELFGQQESMLDGHYLRLWYILKEMPLLDVFNGEETQRVRHRQTDVIDISSSSQYSFLPLPCLFSDGLQLHRHHHSMVALFTLQTLAMFFFNLHSQFFFSHSLALPLPSFFRDLGPCHNSYSLSCRVL